MKYISTRGDATPRDFCEILLEGLAPDGGLYLPQAYPKVNATTLARWLDQGRDDDGRDVVMLDTRNAFELEHGAFDGALDWHLSKFSDFPAALAAHRDELRDRTVVTYCTGGIRCEKAALALQEAGVANVWQLDGGILRYLETMRDAPHWHGRCFVFDERESLDPQLRGVAK